MKVSGCSRVAVRLRFLSSGFLGTYFIVQGIGS